MTKDQIADSIIQAVSILTQGEIIRSEINSSQSQAEEMTVESKNLLEANPFARIQMTQKADVTFENNKGEEVPIPIAAESPYVYNWFLADNNEKLSLVGIEAIITTSIEDSSNGFGAEIEVAGDGGLYVSTLDSSEMLGNINNFIFSLQKKIFDISTIPDVTQIRVTFYNNTGGNVTLHKFSLVAGHDMDKVDEDSDPLILYTNVPELIYTTNEVGETSIDTIKLNARFIYKNERDKWLSVTEKNKDELPTRYRVRWYKTSSDALAYGGDQWGGAYWSYFENPEKFSYTIQKADLSADYEWIKFKVVIIDDEAGGTIAVSSQDVEIRNKKIESAKYIKNISLGFLDGKNGGYPYYALDNQYSEDYSQEIIKQRTVECKINSDFNYQTLYNHIASIKWHYTEDSIIDFGPMTLDGWREINRREENGDIIIEYVQQAPATEQTLATYKSYIQGILKRVYQLPRRRKSNCAVGCEIVFTNGQKYEVEKGIVLSVNGAAGTDNSIIVRLLDAQGAPINAIPLGSIKDKKYYLQINVYDVEGKDITSLNNCKVVLFKNSNSKWGPVKELAPTVEDSFKNCFVFDPGDDHESYKYGYKSEITYSISDADKPLKIIESFLIPTCGEGLEKKIYQGPTKIIYDSAGSNPTYSKAIVSLEGENEITSTIEVGAKNYENSLINGIFTPVQSYDPLYNLTYSEIIIKKDEKTLWHQPLLFEQNKYFSRIINEWDGNFAINEDGNYILASAYVAGSKDDENKFTGAILGELGTITEVKDENGAITEVKTTGKESGLFGYDKGAQTFGFRTDGTAFIGGSGQGRISFDGEKGIIKSDNFKEEDINLDKGKYTKGTFLNLQDGSFKFGGGRLRYDGEELLELDGQFNAVEGEIGGFKIGSSTLTTQVNEDDWDKSVNYLKYDPSNREIPKDAVIIAGKNFVINADNRPGNALSGFDDSSASSYRGWRLLIGANFGVGTGGMAATYAKITTANITNAEAAGFTLKDGAIYTFSDKSNIGVGLRVNADSIDTNPLFAIGIPNDKNKYWKDAPFRVFKNGRLEVNTITVDSTTESIYRDPSDGVNGFALVTRNVGNTNPVLAIGRPYAGKKEDGTLKGHWDDALFKVYEDGKLTVVNAQIQGGTIGNLKVATNGRIYNGTFGNDESIFVSGTPANTAPGSIFGVDGYNNIWYMAVGSRFGVQKGGYVFAKNATLKDSSFYKESTTIGADGSIYINTSTMSGPNSGFLAGINNWLITVGSRFGVADTGLLWAKDAHFKNVTINEGTISDVTIKEGTISDVTIKEGAFQANGGYYLKFKNANGVAVYGLTIGQGGVLELHLL